MATSMNRLVTAERTKLLEFFSSRARGDVEAPAQSDTGRMERRPAQGDGRPSMSYRQKCVGPRRRRADMASGDPWRRNLWTTEKNGEHGKAPLANHVRTLLVHGVWQKAGGQLPGAVLATMSRQVAPNEPGELHNWVRGRHMGGTASER